jgi:hypothetical protein
MTSSPMRSCCFERGVHDRVTEPVRCSGLDDPKLPRLLPKEALAKLREEVEMAKGLCPPFDPQAYRAGHLTSVYFGSPLDNFGARELPRDVGDPTPPVDGFVSASTPSGAWHSRRGDIHFGWAAAAILTSTDIVTPMCSALHDR